MTADRARGALAVLQDADGKFICEVPCGYIVEQTASAHKPRRIQAQRRRRAMLDKVKLALRLSGTALDGEVSDLINAAIADLRLVGINIPAEAGSSSKTLGDPLLDRAVVLYAKAEFGFNDDAERYRNAYDYLKCALSLTADYTEESEGK